MTFKRFFKVFLLPFLGIVALVNFYKGYSFKELMDGLRSCKIRWVVLATFMHLVNHFLRGYRWRLLMGVEGRLANVFHCVCAEMTGFFSNLFVPRLGELTRCTSLRGMSGVSIKKSLPSVVAERSIDIFVFVTGFLAVFGISFFLEEKKYQFIFTSFFSRLANSLFFNFKHLAILLCILTFTSLFVWYLYRLFRDYLQDFFAAFLALLRSTKSTILHIKPMVWLVTFFIWFSYFLVEYISCFALEGTAQLGFFPIFCLFIVINLGTAIPVPGNVGAYHILMYSTLCVFNVGDKDAMVYVTITHGIQVFNALVVGGVCTLVSSLIKGKSSDVEAVVEK